MRSVCHSTHDVSPEGLATGRAQDQHQESNLHGEKQQRRGKTCFARWISGDGGVCSVPRPSKEKGNSADDMGSSFRERYVHRAVETLLLARAELVSIQLTAPERRQEAYLRVETAEQRRRLIRCILQATTGTDRDLDSSFHP